MHKLDLKISRKLGGMGQAPRHRRLTQTRLLIVPRSTSSRRGTETITHVRLYKIVLQPRGRISDTLRKTQTSVNDCLDALGLRKESLNGYHPRLQVSPTSSTKETRSHPAPGHADFPRLFVLPH